MGYGFLGDGSGAELNNETNEAVTGFGFLDELVKVGSQGKQAMPGSKVLGPVGFALSALGLANDAYDINKRGLNGENGLNATGNALGAAAMIPGPVGSVAAAGAGGLAYGSAANDYIAGTGALGENVDGSNRSWSDMAADWATSADDAAGGGALGTAAGIAALTAGTVVGGAGAIASAPAVVGDMALDVGAAGLDVAGDAWDYVWS